MTFAASGQSINREQLRETYKLGEHALAIKERCDRELAAIIRGEDDRILLIIGPCSSDDETAVLEYAYRLSRLQKSVEDRIFVIMRVYTAKPRTTGDGYKGLIHQPNMDTNPSCHSGIVAVRRIHYRVISEAGIITADEMLYPENLPLVQDLVSYVTVGARSVENQQHRFVSSGIDVPTGMKNPTSGNISVLFNSIYVAQNKHTFWFNGQEVKTSGNSFAHVILRGSVDEYGKNVPNYYYDNLISVIRQYAKMGLKYPFIVVDTNHDNSGKRYLEQVRIIRQTFINREWDDDINRYVRGFMIESYLEDGRQDKPKIFGKSITDPCLGWGNTEQLVREIYNKLERPETS